VGATGLNLGLAHECAAYVAAALQQPDPYAQHARQVQAIFLAFPNAALAAKYQRLVRAGRSDDDSAPQVLPDSDRDARLRAQLESALRTCSDRQERLERALALLIEATGAHGGALFALAGGAVEACAQSAAGVLPPEIASMAARHFQSVLGAGAEEATTALTEPSLSGLWTSSIGHGYRPVLLGHHDAARFVISGLVVLRCEQLVISPETALTAAQLSKIAVERGDLVACAGG
jgi:hypothetical protein